MKRNNRFGRRDRMWEEAKGIFLENLDPRMKSIMNVLAENTKDVYMNAYMRQQGNGLLLENASSGAISAANIGSLVKLALPVMRRALPETITQNIVGTVPLDAPVAQISSLRPRYGRTISGAGTIAGQEALAPLHVRALARAYSGNENEAIPAAAGASLLEGVLGNTMTMDVVKQTVTAGTRRMSARWTDEALMDARSQYGIDLAASIMENMSTHMAQEIDQEILGTLRSIVPLPTAANTFDQAAVSGQPNSVVDEFASLAVLMQREAYRVAARTRKAPANWAVLSPTMVSVLESARAATLVRTTDSGSNGFEAPVAQGNKIGRLNNSIDIFVDMYANDSQMVLLGLKVSDNDAPLIYAPYVPISTVNEAGVIRDPNTFENITGIWTRYAIITFTDQNTSLGNSADYLGAVGVASANLSFI